MNNEIKTNYNSITQKYELNINGQVFSSSKIDEFKIPLSIVEHIDIRQFPVGLSLIPDIDIDNMTDLNEADVVKIMKIKNSAGKKIKVEFNICLAATGASQYFISYLLYQETLADLLLLNKKLKLKILANLYNGVRFHFHCSIKVPNDSIGVLVLRTFELYHTTSRRVLQNSIDFREILRINLKLPVSPSKQAKVKYSPL